MNAPDEKRRLAAEFEEFKELLRHSGPANPNSEAPPVEPIRRESARPSNAPTDARLEAQAWKEAVEPLLNGSARVRDTARAEDVGGAEPNRPAPPRAYKRKTRKPKETEPGEAAESQAMERAARFDFAALGEGRKRTIYLAAALAIVLGGAIAVGSVLSNGSGDAPETATAEPIPSPAQTEEANSAADGAEAPARDASLLASPPAESASPAETPFAAAPAAQTPLAEAPRELTPPDAGADSPVAPAEPRPADAIGSLPEGALAAPSGAAQTVAPPPLAPPAPAASSLETPRTSVPAPKAAAAKPQERGKPAPIAKPAKPKPESAAKAKPAPTKPEAPTVAAPTAAPPAPPAAQAAPSEQPGFMQQAVDAVTGTVGDLGRATGVLPER